MIKFGIIIFILVCRNNDSRDVEDDFSLTRYDNYRASAVKLLAVMTVTLVAVISSACGINGFYSNIPH